jgi:energy-coupling factor transport system permease protein
LPAVAKIILYSVFCIVVFLIQDIRVYLFLLVPMLILFFFSPSGVMQKGWLTISVFLLFTFLSNAFFQHGKILFKAGPLTLTTEGFDIAAVRTMRVFFLIAGAKVLTATSRTETLIDALGRLLRPLEHLGLPVRDLFSTMTLTVQSLPKLKVQIREAYQQNVKESPPSGFWDRVVLVSGFLLPLFLRTLQSPEKIFKDDSVHERNG